jgi:hypothetical protein
MSLPQVNVYLHGPFFARAVAEHPDDPLKSEYAPSIHAALRGAREIFVWLGTLLKTNPASCARQLQYWNIALAAGVTVDLIRLSFCN